MKCGGTATDFFPVQTVVRQGCVLTPSLFCTCMDWIMGHVVGRTSCGASFGDVWMTDLDFGNDAMILAGTIETLTKASRH